MKLEVLLITLLTLAGTTLFFQGQQTQQEGFESESFALLEMFENWTQQHGFNYNAKEMEYRFNVFKENYAFIQKYNAENPEVVLGLNAFAAMTNDEYRAQYTTKITQATGFPTVETQIKDDVPSTFNWVEKGAVNPVQNQGQCGSCWAFATVATLEGLNEINSGNLQKFSEQQVTSCTPAPFSNGCNGGNPLFAMYYTASAGIQSEASYKYVQASNPKTAPCDYNSNEVVYKNKGGAGVKPNSPQSLQSQLLEQPVVVLVEASGIAFQLYQSGVISKNCGTELDHAITLVGYNTTDASNEYWIVRNSWGASWGNKGYVNIAMTNGKGVCGINMSPSFPTA